MAVMERFDTKSSLTKLKPLKFQHRDDQQNWSTEGVIVRFWLLVED